ncbi:TM2 domain-containing protein [bacterium]|nr:TM2 domain-containing protein [bacterium]
MAAIIFCFFLGGLGIHRFYVGKIGTGVLYLFTFGLFGIGVIVDFIMLVCDNFKDIDNNVISYAGLEKKLKSAE